jgi:hypothetical protein
VRVLGLAIAVVGLAVAAACGGGDDSPTPGPLDRDNALQLAVAYRLGVAESAPNPGEEYDCIIPVALQPQFPQPTLHPVQGTCRWNIDFVDGEWIATYTESWRCDDFTAHYLDFPDCVPPLGFHEWKYKVDLKTSAPPVEISSRGNFAPDQKVATPSPTPARH